MERSLITDRPRDRYVERSKQRAFDYLDRSDLKKRGRLVRQQAERPSETTRSAEAR